MALIYVNNDIVISSDWHVLHRNIYWFLPEERKLLSGGNVNHSMGYDEYLEAEKRIYQKMLNNIQCVIESRNISRFLMLGDFIFGLNKGAIANKIIDELDLHLPVIYEIFEYLKYKGVKCSLVFGNHDDFKLNNAKVKALYDFLFDDVHFYIRDGDVIYTHFPLGYSIANDRTKDTEDAKYYRMNKAFYKIDKELLSELNSNCVTNYHGHIHSGDFLYPHESVEYRNVAIDMSVISLG